MPTFDRQSMTIDTVLRDHGSGNASKDSDLVEGYWKDISHPNLPSPKTHSKDWDGKILWIGKLIIVEAKIAPRGHHELYQNTKQEISEYRFLTYADDSDCRICNQKNGRCEYQIQMKTVWYRWPDGLRHYFDAHNVIPSKQFYELINELSRDLNW